jgi:hypothetical protein
MPYSIESWKKAKMLGERSLARTKLAHRTPGGLDRVRPMAFAWLRRRAGQTRRGIRRDDNTTARTIFPSVFSWMNASRKVRRRSDVAGLDTARGLSSAALAEYWYKSGAPKRRAAARRRYAFRKAQGTLPKRRKKGGAILITTKGIGVKKVKGATGSFVRT